VTIKYKKSSHKFSGDLSSQFAECESARQVRLMKVKRGKDKSVGKDTSSASGGWSIRRRSHGKYYAVALPKSLSTSAGDQVDCQRGKSKTRKI
jgi:hypothetical protein